MEQAEKQREKQTIADKLHEQLEYVNTDLIKTSREKIKAKIIADIEELEQTGDVDKVSSIIFQQISDEYLRQPKDFPESLVKLYFRIRVERDKYDSLNWGPVQAGLDWFE